MPSYHYKALDKQGKAVSGQVYAPDEQALYQKLKLQGAYLQSAQPVQTAVQSKKLKPRALADFCRQLGTLLGAGVPLVRALEIMTREEGLRPAQRQIYTEVQRLLRQGVSLSDAMEQQGAAFPPLLINMVRAAQESGSLDRSALRMADYYERDSKQNTKVKNAMVYPMVLLCLMVVVVIFVVAYVVPQFAELFAAVEELPLPTRIVLAMADLVQHHWQILLAAAAVLVVFFAVLGRVSNVRAWRDKMILHLPVVGRLLKVIYTARFARTLSSLYATGLPMLLILQVGRSTVGNAYVEQQFDDVLAAVRAGESLSAALGRVDGFVQKLPATIMVGEETGHLDTLLDSICDSLDYESEMAINRLVTLLEPLLIVIMGLLVGFLVIAVIMPIYDSYGAIGAGL